MKTFAFVYLAIGEVLFFVGLFGSNAKADYRRLRDKHGRVRAWFISFMAFNVFVLLWPASVYFGVRGVIRRIKQKNLDHDGPAQAERPDSVNDSQGFK